VGTAHRAVWIPAPRIRGNDRVGCDSDSVGGKIRGGR